ncbi:TetR family transcriptional regulator [Alsobacter metallidurans]|uniref:TetR family transcriptional regulator n=1 Tax=Alsobacter metallidurans TaxID=340221 RepID=A0A917ICP7_9HYPH|nr:TetR family transcriptional regulator [Alsobacter metallidurans]GGH31228.1 TetR family transcriptional regulator [Alsobacter metallidurans]
MHAASAPPADSVDARILAIAADHVRRYGMARTTVTAVAKEAGMTHANVYRYYASKVALADAITAAWLRPIEQLLAEVVDAPDPADDKLERMILALAGALRDKLEADPNLFELYVEAYEAARGVARKHRSRVRMLIDRVVEEGIGSGVFNIRRPEKAVTLLLDVVFRFIHPVAIRLDCEAPRRMLDDRVGIAVRVALRAFGSGMT